MPIIVCTSRAGMDVATKREIARQITDAVHETIGADRAIISVVFNDVPAESGFVGGDFGSDTLITCNIRAGRSDAAKEALVKRISDIWAAATGQDDEHIEVGFLEKDPRYVVRGGKRLPDPPLRSRRGVKRRPRGGRTLSGCSSPRSTSHASRRPWTTRPSRTS